MAEVIRTEIHTMGIDHLVLTHSEENLLGMGDPEVRAHTLVSTVVEINHLLEVVKEKLQNTTPLMVCQTTEGSIGVR